jgi:hypothetical protein
MNPNERIDDPQEATRAALGGLQSRLWTALPGYVVAFDAAAQTVSVQPTIQGQVSDQNGDVQAVNMPLLVDVPVIFPRAGGFAVTFPVAAGDEVLVVFASRCIDSWWQSGGIGAPVEARMHDLSDGFAIPGPTSQARKLSGVSTANMQLRTESGGNFIELSPAGKVRIVCSEFEVVSAGAATVSAPSLTHNGTNVGASHTHPGVQTGAGNTGGAQ